jgi:NADP-dependent 3-hydroxy acid dehydrogenase YdfG
VWINNAGIMPLSFLNKLKVEEWDRMIDVNIKGVLYGIAAVLPIMERQKSGHIINVASVAGHRVGLAGAVYSGTKFAVRAITEGLRMEVSPSSRIRTTIISPGSVATELRDTITDQDALNVLLKRKIEKPLDAKDIAEAIIYAVEQPEHVSVNEILIRPTTQPN